MFATPATASLRSQPRMTRTRRWWKAEVIHLHVYAQRWITSLRARDDGARRSVISQLIIGALLLSTATNACAQVASPTAPTVTAPTAPTIPTVTAPTFASTDQPPATPTNADLSQQLQKLTGKNNPQALAQVVVLGSLLGCTQKTAGKDATNAFYQQMQAVGKQAEAACKAGKPEDARALMINTFKQQQASAVVKAALGCYDAQKQTVEAIGGPALSADVAHYAGWLRDPTKAEKEMQTGDICRKALTANRQPLTVDR